MSAPLAHLGEIRTRGWQILDELVTDYATKLSIGVTTAASDPNDTLPAEL